MANRITSLSHEMQRVLDLGMIDLWLRGLGQLTPRPAATGGGQDSDGFNTHMLGFERPDAISAADIQQLAGCRQLLARCTRHDVAIDIKFKENGYLIVHFKPEQQFKNSVIFGASYHNVLPTLFALPALHPQGTH